MTQRVRRGGKSNRKHGKKKDKPAQQRYVAYGRSTKNAEKRAERHAKRVAYFEELRSTVRRLRRADALSSDPTKHPVRA